MASSRSCEGYSARSIRNGLVAGYSAGLCGIIVGHPLDSVKVLLQTSGGASVLQTSTPSNTKAASTMASSGHVLTRALSNAASNALQSSSAKANVSTATLVPQETGKRSLRALYAGATGPLLTIGLLQSINFAIYDSVRRVLYQRQVQSEHPNGLTCNIQPGDYLHYDNLSNVAIASFVAGGSTSILTSPMLVVKTKQQLMVWGFRKAIRETCRCGINEKPHHLNALRNFYTGFGVHFFCDAFGRSVYMFTYELLKRKLAQGNSAEQYSQSDFMSTQNLSLSERMLCAASAGMACWAFIFPADVIRSKLYAKSLATQSSLTTADGIELVRQMVRDQGFRSLYRGMTITVARAAPVAAAVLPVYDTVLAWLSS
eukprot:CAMPEP_0172535088 /NCGR_PEP_ID=MMETSP1067-20121228/7240_1 /TAXON_ID=265564 ORGANISM="Thalassiosira punctigera, Strain Tpunct2005C2" /NCGR_SAMPLE_ID=MMETSP1067 /ASSEMBLY_ACC=CAM_ASM_000444 /LENGTH=371 /DNA_ID=CAMNT_0013319983 /DNA_START=161 /DNA_END=1276 /DNA_ORIENTATION=-